MIDSPRAVAYAALVVGSRSVMLAFAFLLAATPAAFPCAGLVHEVGELAESDAQEAIHWQDGGESVIEYRGSYEGDASDIGWIIVVPAGFASLADGDAARFDELRAATQPLVWMYGGDAGSPGPACGCSGNLAKGGFDGANALDTGTGFDILSEGFTGTYSYTAFSADDAAGLTDALETLGWPPGDGGATLGAYAEEGGVDFVLVEVRPDVAEMDGVRSLPPVVIRSTAERLFFPSRMALGATADEMRTVVWVLGDQRARVTGWDMVDAGDPVEAMGEQTAEEAWDESLRTASSDGPTFVRSWSSAWEDGWVTRFDTLTPTPLHDIDADFIVDDGRDVSGASVEVWASIADSGAAVLLLPLLGAGVAVRRRRQA